MGRNPPLSNSNIRPEYTSAALWIARKVGVFRSGIWCIPVGYLVYSGRVFTLFCLVFLRFLGLPNLLLTLFINYLPTKPYVLKFSTRAGVRAGLS